MTALRHPRRRPGVTLTEVVVAMFVMALGFMALLTLFPLGAIQIAQAVKDDRCAQCAQQGDAAVRGHWRMGLYSNVFGSSAPAATQYCYAMDDPNLFISRPSTSASPALAPYRENIYITGGYLPFAPPATAIPAGATGTPISPTSLVNDLYFDPTTLVPSQPQPAPPTYYVTAGGRASAASYPVLLDPIGWFARGATNQEQFWVARNTYPPTAPTVPLLIPRRKFGTVNDPITGSQQAAFRLCALTDDLTFDPNGTPELNNLRRQGRYTWAALVQRPDNTRLSVATLKILVFDGRSPFTIPSQDEVVVVPPAASAVAPVVPPIANGVSRSIVLDVPNRTAEQAPLVRKGGWIMDGTIHQPGNVNTGVRSGRFYRIVGVTEDAPGTATTRYTLDLDRAIEWSPATALANTDFQFYLFAGLAEVFDRDDLTANEP